MAFCIDFAVDGKNVPADRLEILEYDQQTLEEELKEFGVKNAIELTDYDRVVFETENKAEEFLKQFLMVLAGLKTENFCISRNLPAMAYTKRHLVMSIMGFKNQTYRDYKKDWPPGQLFNLHDRTHFLTVRLLQIKKIGNQYKYEFQLP